MSSKQNEKDTVSFTVEDRIAWVRFNRPTKRNAQSPSLNRRMYEVISELEFRDDVGLLVLTGEGDAWCAGMDLKEYFRETEAQGLGGTRKAVFNSEILMPFPGVDKSFRFGPFFDAGNVFTDNYTYAEEGLRTSVGLAAAWISPLGPLKFSYGQPINEQSNDKLQKFQFQFGTTF